MIQFVSEFESAICNSAPKWPDNMVEDGRGSVKPRLYRPAHQTVGILGTLVNGKTFKGIDLDQLIGIVAASLDLDVDLILSSSRQRTVALTSPFSSTAFRY